MRRFLTWLAVGALFGGVVATLVAPYVLETLLASTGAKDAMCQCSELVDRTATLLIKTQLWGMALGAAAFPIGAWFMRRKFGGPSDGALPPATGT